MALDKAVIYTGTVYTRVVYTPADYTTADCTGGGSDSGGYTAVLHAGGRWATIYTRHDNG